MEKTKPNEITLEQFHEKPSNLMKAVRIEGYLITLYRDGRGYESHAGNLDGVVQVLYQTCISQAYDNEGLLHVLTELSRLLATMERDDGADDDDEMSAAVVLH